jgi:glycosyltransferase involved in cell wall biosynthesis
MPAQRVAVVIPAHERPEMLRRTLDSLLAQTLAPAEVVVVDDCSTPPLEPLVDLPADLRLAIVRNPRNLGTPRTVARGVHETTAPLVAIVNDDDYWAPEFLERLTTALLATPGAVVAFCDHHVVDGDGCILSDLTAETSRAFGRAGRPEGPVPDLPRAALVDRSIAAMSFAVVRREAIRLDLIERGGPAWDLFLALSLVLSGGGGVFVAERLGFHASHEGSVSATGRDPVRRWGSLACNADAQRIALNVPRLAAVHGPLRRKLLRLSFAGAKAAVQARRPGDLGRSLSWALDAARPR